jgi:DNA-binding winged helix-turn-helix (wHTH) protein
MVFRFGVFEVDVHAQQIRKNGVRIRLQGKPFRLLIILLERSGEVVTREEFHRALWSGDAFGEVDHNLNNAMNKLRSALRDIAATPRYIETLPRVGYRFTFPVDRNPQAKEALSVTVPQPPEPSKRFVVGRWWAAVAAVFLVCCALVVTLYSVRRFSRQVSSAAAESLLENRSVDPAARTYYVKGRYFWNKRNRPDLLLAIRYFQEAVARDPKYALAYSGLADSYSVLGMVSTSPRALYEDALRMALESVSLDESSAEAHASLALVYECNWQFRDATREFQKAIVLNPSYPTVHHWYGLHLRSLGSVRSGREELELAHRLDPSSSSISFALANAYRKDGYYGDAARGYAEIAKFDSSFQRVKAGVALLNATQHRPMSADASDPQATASFEEAPEVAEYVAAGLYQEGQKRQAIELMARLTQRVPALDGRCFPVLLAAMGKREELLNCLEEAYAERAGYLPQVKTDPWFRDVQSDPRFQHLFARIGFPSAVAAN